MQATLADQTCVPCKGGVPPLDGRRDRAAAGPARRLGGRGRQAAVAHLPRQELRRGAGPGQYAWAVIAEDQQHHPDLYVAWGKLRVEVWTHKIDGLTDSDFVFAAKCDRAYAGRPRRGGLLSEGGRLAFAADRQRATGRGGRDRALDTLEQGRERIERRKLRPRQQAASQHPPVQEPAQDAREVHVLQQLDLVARCRHQAAHVVRLIAAVMPQRAIQRAVQIVLRRAAAAPVVLAARAPGGSR